MNYKSNNSNYDNYNNYNYNSNNYNYNDNNDNNNEINLPNEIFKKQLTLLLTNKTEIILLFHALEYNFPYTLTMLFISNSTYNRIDIKKEDLALELRQWLAGKVINNPCKIVSNRINEIMMNFVKYGKPPSQTDIFMWMLSRTEIYPKKNKLLIYFGGKDNTISQDYNNYSTEEVQKLISLNSSSLSPNMNNTLNTNSFNNNNNNSNNNSINNKSTTLERSKSAPTKRSMFNNGNNTQTQTNTNTKTNLNMNLTNMNDFTNVSVEPPIQELIGKSQAISLLQTNEVKGRKDAKKSIVNLELSDDHYRLMNHISNRRKEIEKTLEARRRVIKTGVVRNDQTINKYRQIYENTNKLKNNNNWVRTANEEVMNLDRIQTLLEEDLKRQAIQNQRNAEHIRWTMAPNGYEIYRGKYQKGYVIGPGPLPPDATTSLRDSRIASTLKNYTWDEHGRRHRINELNNNSNNENQSNMEDAMNIIRKASTNASLYKLNLKDIFDDMDVSGDGYINIQEMKVTFEKLGLSLDMESLNNLFNYFDKNHSGTVHYGEFMWAFFNRRSFLKQYKKNTKNLTKSQIVNKFYEYDNNGNGTLNQKEFKKLLKSLKIELNESDILILMNRFDLDGDGELDVDELYKYIQEELENNNENTTEKVTSTSTSTSTSKRLSQETANKQLNNDRNSKLSTNSSKDIPKKSNKFQQSNRRSVTPPPPPYSVEPDEESSMDDIDNYLMSQKSLLASQSVRNLSNNNSSSNNSNDSNSNSNNKSNKTNSNKNINKNSRLNGSPKLEYIDESENENDSEFEYNNNYDEQYDDEDYSEFYQQQKQQQNKKDWRNVVTVDNIQELLKKQPAIESKLKKYYNKLNQTN